MKSIVLVSGGLDSVVNLKIACDRGEAILALTFDYGQQCFDNEATAAASCAGLLGVPHKIVELGWYEHILPDAMAGRNSVQKWQTKDEIDRDKALKEAWIPNRNGVLVNIAAAYAEFLGAQSIVMGLNREEGAIFPDNSSDFLKACNHALSLSTLSKVELISYTVDLTKREIVKLGLGIDAPLDLIYSCYLRSEDQRMCGSCQSCLRVKHALEANGIYERLEGRFRE